MSDVEAMGIALFCLICVFAIVLTSYPSDVARPLERRDRG